MLRTRRPSRSWGNCCHSCKIAVLNSSIFWYFGLRWLLFRPIKSHTCSIGFMSGDIAGHGIVWTASCCKTYCTIRALSGLALSSMNIDLSANAYDCRNRGLRVVRAHCHGIFACQITIKNVHIHFRVKGKTTPYSYTSSPKAVVPKMWLSWNEVFRWRQTLARPSVGVTKNDFHQTSGPVTMCK
jgi:hypothetical protein